MNSVQLVGRMTKDVDCRVTQSGTYVSTFTLAVNRTFKTNDGVEADFIQCVVWGKKAESTANYCGKGSLVGIKGELRTRSYDNKQGQKVYVTEVLCDNVEFLQSKKEVQSSRDVVENDPFKQFNNNENSFNIIDDIQF